MQGSNTFTFWLLKQMIKEDHYCVRHKGKCLRSSCADPHPSRRRRRSRRLGPPRPQPYTGRDGAHALAAFRLSTCQRAFIGPANSSSELTGLRVISAGNFRYPHRVSREGAYGSLRGGGIIVRAPPLSSRLFPLAAKCQGPLPHDAITCPTRLATRDYPYRQTKRLGRTRRSVVVEVTGSSYRAAVQGTATTIGGGVGFPCRVTSKPPGDTTLITTPAVAGGSRFFFSRVPPPGVTGDLRFTPGGAIGSAAAEKSGANSGCREDQRDGSTDSS